MTRRALFCAALALAAGACRRPDVPILTWHSVGGGSDEFAVTQATLTAQLDALQRAGFHTVSFRQWLEHEDRGAPLPDKPVLLTFDDGYRDALTAALPALRARGMRATFFLVSGWMGGQAPGADARPCLTWDEARALLAAGMEIGSHGATHRRLSELTEAQALEELTASKRELESRLGTQVDVFAYPFNASRRWLRSLVQKAGYRAAVSGVDHGGADRYELYRFGIQQGTSPDDVVRAAK